MLGCDCYFVQTTLRNVPPLSSGQCVLLPAPGLGVSRLHQGIVMFLHIPLQLSMEKLQPSFQPLQHSCDPLSSVRVQINFCVVHRM